MPSSRPPSPQISASDAPTIHPEPLSIDLLPQEPISRTSPPDITNTSGHGSQSLSPSPPSPPPPPVARPPQFAPLFALISSSASPSGGNGSSGSSPTHHHPTVHYIFADDHDSDLLITAAALQTLDSDPDPDPGLSPPPPPARPRRVGDGQSRENNARGGGRGGGRRGEGGAAVVAPPERFLIVDLDPTATRVVAARSMAPDWQIVHADLTPAPTWEGEESNDGKTGGGEGAGDGDGGGGGRGLMLSVEGVGTTRGAAGEEVNSREGGEVVEEGLEKLAERYERRLGELRRVVEGVGAGAGAGAAEGG